jgi:hypothetical protein
MLKAEVIAKKPSQPTGDLKAKVDLLDLEPIAFKLVYPEDGQGWTPEKAYRLIELYRCFLVLNEIYPNISIVPSKEIDKVWHAHILDTAKYREDCQRVFGRFVDHFPYFGMRGEEDAKNLQTTYQATRALFIEHFGVDPSISNVQVADCGSAGCGSCDSATYSSPQAADCGSGSCSPSCDAGECGGCADGPSCDAGACTQSGFDRSRPSLAISLQAI